MTDLFMKSSDLRTMYGLKESDTFDSAFSKVSLESIIFDIVAATSYALETIFDIFVREVDEKIATAVVASIAWYYRICLEYQHGDALKLNESTSEYAYEQVDESKRIVKYAACRDQGGGVSILVAGQGADGYPKALSGDVLTAFKEYVSRRKPAGILMDVHSYDPDVAQIYITVQYDPLILNPDGTLISSSSDSPVERAVNDYLAGITYGGTLNKTKLVDAVQAALGVVDVNLASILVRRADQQSFKEVAGNNYQSEGGSFRADDLKSTISYVLEI